MRALIASLPKLSILLVFIPVAIVLQVLGIDGMPLFIISGLGILGTVTLIGKATEEVAIYTGPLWGGLLNATFGNVTELIIAMVALTKGPEMYPIVLGSIVGSILGNLLLVLGGAMVYGGTKYQVQKFSRTGAHVNVGMLWVVLAALTVPSLISVAYHLDPDTEALTAEPQPGTDNTYETDGGPTRVAANEPSPANAPNAPRAGKSVNSQLDVFPDVTVEDAEEMVRRASMTAAVILLVLYGLGLLFSLRTHRFLLMPDVETHEKAEWSKGTSIAMLLGATLAVAYLSEAFVSSIEHMKEHDQIVLSEMFIGVIVVAVVGNAAEGMVAVWVARDNKMELSFQIAMGSCLQVALMVAPVLVIASYFMHGWDEMMTLAFDPFMLMSLAAATMIAASALNDGESNWLEGAMFLAVYLFFALVFFFHP